MSVIEACRILSHKEGLWKGNNVNTLEQRFYELERKVEEIRKSPITDPLLIHLNLIAGNSSDVDLSSDGTN